MARIRPYDLDPLETITQDAAIVVDNGTTVGKVDPAQLVNFAVPVASQEEAEAGAVNNRMMTPLRVAQYLNSGAVTADSLTGDPEQIQAIKDKLGLPFVSTREPRWGIVADGVADDTEGMQAFIDYCVNNRLRGIIHGTPAVTALTTPDDWTEIVLEGEAGGVAYTGAEGTCIKFTGGGNGLTIPLRSNNHNRVDISSLAFVNAVDDVYPWHNKRGSGIYFDIDGTRTYNYPINWRFNVAFRNWENEFCFKRNGGVIDPGGFVGRIIFDRVHGWANLRWLLIDGCYLNMCEAQSMRQHSTSNGTEGWRVKGGGGAFIDFYSCHWEGIGIPDQNGGLCFHEAYTLECAYSMHDHDWEGCNALYTAEGEQTHSPRFVFTGRQRVNSYQVPIQELGHIQIANYSDQPFTIIPRGTIIETPSTIRVRTRTGGAITGKNSTRVTHYYVPTRAYDATRRTALAQPIAGQRQFGAASVGAERESSWPYVRSTGPAVFSTNAQIGRSPEVTASAQVFVVSWVMGITQGTTRIFNPADITLNDGTATSFQVFGTPIRAASGEYCCVVMVKAESGMEITTLDLSPISPSGNVSIGYGSWHEDAPTAANALCMPRGYVLPHIRDVPSGGSITAPFRSASGADAGCRVRVSVKGLGSGEWLVRGAATNPSSRTVVPVASTFDASVTCSVTVGPSDPDICAVAVTNNSLSSRRVIIEVEKLS